MFQPFAVIIIIINIIQVQLSDLKSTKSYFFRVVNPLNAELNPIRHLLALVGARHIVHVSRIGLNSIT